MQTRQDAGPQRHGRRRSAGRGHRAERDPGRLYWDNGPLPIPGFYDKVRPLTDKERAAFAELPGDEEQVAQGHWASSPASQFAMEKGCHAYEQTWRRPAVTVIAQEASSIKGASNQVLPKASAIVSCRIVPDQDPEEVFEQLKAFLTKDPPWGVEVKVTPHGPPVKWWMTDPNGPAFEAALAAMQDGLRQATRWRSAAAARIGFVGPLAELFGGAPALLLGIEDPASNAHAPNESLHEGDWKKLMASLVAPVRRAWRKVPGGKVK